MINKGIFFVLILHFSGLWSQSTINALDSEGKRNGLWKGLYEPSKRVRYQGTFEHGKEVGLFQYYDDTKASDIIATREFNEKDHSAYTIFYNQNKFKVSEGKVVNKLFEGEWIYYHFNSKAIMTKELYKNGKLSGLRTVYFPDGKVAEETHYEDGFKHGSCKIYSDKGIVLEETVYQKGQYNGPAIFRDANGFIASKGNFVLGKKEGVWEFYEKDKLVKKRNMSYPEGLTKGKKN
ncbi:toxin-antitoxin system YwqK family antitoxin [Flavobacterium sp. TSSA_36]|uniref:toxin-antitoxin system YwqK family antitoxin n=1 Tax=Flavobacterium sp. TSSA_36 TaxID=3447669 RepID=UPI003F34BE06